MIVTRYELHKIVRNPFLWAVIAVLLVVNCLDVLRFWDEYRDRRSPEDTRGAALFALFDAAEPDPAVLTYFRATYGTTTDDFTFPVPAEWATIQGQYADKMTEASVFYDYLSNQTYLSDFLNADRAAIVRQAAALNAEAVRTEDAFAVRRGNQIIRAFTPTITTPTQRSLGWNYVFAYDLWGIFALLVMVLAVAPMFSSEHEKGTIVLLQSTKYGCRQTARAKLLAAVIAAVGVDLLFALANVGFAWIRFGLRGWNMPIQSIHAMPAGGGLSAASVGFKLSPLVLTVGQTFGLFLGLTVLGAAFFATVLCFLSSLFRRDLSAFAAGMGFLGGSFGLTWLFKGHNIRPAFWDITAFLRPSTFLVRYNAANVLGRPVLWAWVQIGVWLLVAAVLGVIVVTHFGRNSRKQLTLITRTRRAVEPVGKHSLPLCPARRVRHIFQHEMCKILRPGGWVVLGLLALKLVILLVIPEQIDPRIALSDRQYNAYLDIFQGEHTPEKSAQIEQAFLEMQDRAASADMMAEQCDDGDISADVFYAFIQELYEDENRRPSLEIFGEKSDAFTRFQDAHPDLAPPEYMREFGWETVFGFAHFPDVCLVLAVVFLAIGSFAPEFQNDSLLLIHSAKNGRNRLFLTKTAVLLCAVFTAVLAGTLLEVIVFSARFDLTQTTPPLYSLTTFGDNPDSLSIGEGWAVTLLLRGAGAVLFALFVQAVSVLLRNTVAAACTAPVSVALPLLLDAGKAGDFTHAALFSGSFACGALSLAVVTGGTVALWGIAGKRWG